MRLFSSFFKLIVIALISGCATKAPETHYYVLSQAQQPADIQHNQHDLVIGISQPSIASHLSKLGIVTEQSEQEIYTARYHRWAEDIGLGITRTLQSDLSRTNPRVRFDNSYSAILPDWQYRIHIQVDQFNGSMDGNAIFAGYWRIEDINSDKITTARHFLLQQPMSGQGYEKLVSALRQCTRLLAHELGHEIQKISRNQR